MACALTRGLSSCCGASGWRRELAEQESKSPLQHLIFCAITLTQAINSSFDPGGRFSLTLRGKKRLIGYSLA